MIWSCFLVLLSCNLVGQDSIVPQEHISEKTQLQFQDYFFDALTEKGINNHKKAIELLNECNQLMPNNKAVLFELSKNHYQLNQLPLAIEYATTALQQEADNIWILEHLVKVHKKQRNFEAAIAIQQKIAEKQPKKKRELVYLYLQNKDKTAAKSLLQELATSKLLTARLLNIKKNLEQPHPVKKINISTGLPSQTTLKSTFEKEKTYVSLKKLLQHLYKTNSNDLLEYSKAGLALFPAQPFVYLMNGRAYNQKQQFKKAVSTLKNGIDFVIDDENVLREFYQELLKAYTGLSDVKKIRDYQDKLK